MWIGLILIGSIRFSDGIAARQLPPANSLVVFEAAARHLNFTRAAQELSVTQAAVSRQIQLLEDHLGTALFQRSPRALKLTPPGRTSTSR